MLVGKFAHTLLAAGLLSSAAAAAEQPLHIDPVQSRVEVAVKATMDSFVGRLNAYEPTITLADDGNISGARFAFHFRDVVTGKEGRDKAMHKWQDSVTHPDGLFVLSSLENGTGNTKLAHGRLTLHGVTRDVQFPVTLHRDGPLYALNGDVPIDTRDFGLPVIRMIAVLKVDPIVHVRFHLQGARRAPPTSHDMPLSLVR